MGILLMPEAAVDIAPIEEFVMAAYVVNLAFIKNQDRVRRYERRQTV